MSLNLRPSEETTLASRGYRLIKKLGEGSYAQVYQAEFTTTEGSTTKAKILACKIIDIGKAPKDFVIKFLPRELEILVKLNHPHIIHVHSIFQRKNKYFIFMRQAELGDMLEFILKKGPIGESQSRVWTRQLTAAIQYLHEMEVAHRDLKCENCLITKNYNLKLGDFGFSRYVIDGHGRKVSSSTYCGSLSYAAPEILRGSPYYPKISDLWSVGVIIYIMLNKAMPFDDTNVKRLHEQQVNRRWKFRAKVVDSLSDEVKKLVVHLLEPDVSKRWKPNQILSSEWIMQDPRLARLTSAEEAALAHAQVDRKNLIEQLRKQSNITQPTVAAKAANQELVMVLKQADKDDGKELTKEGGSSEYMIENVQRRSRQETVEGITNYETVVSD